MTDKITQIKSQPDTPQHRLEMARLTLEQARLAYAKALAEVGQISLEDSHDLSYHSPAYAELERQRDEARKHGGFSLLK